MPPTKRIMIHMIHGWPSSVPAVPEPKHTARAGRTPDKENPQRSPLADSPPPPDWAATSRYTSFMAHRKAKKPHHQHLVGSQHATNDGASRHALRT